MNEVYEIAETYRGVIAAIENEECTADAMSSALRQSNLRSISYLT